LRRGPGGGLAAWPPAAPLFMGADGGRISRGTLQYRVLRAFRRAGIDADRARGALVHARVAPHLCTEPVCTEPANSEVSVYTLMKLLVTTEMTLRYASLAAPTIRIAYEEAMSKTRNRLALTIAPVGKPIVSNRIEWLREEMLKTRVAHGYCSRQLAAEACAYAATTMSRRVLPHLDDDLAFGTSVLDVVHGVLGLVEGKYPVHDWANGSLVDEGGDLAQLSAVRPHEQERKCHVESLRLSPRAEAQDVHDRLHVPRHTDFFREGRVGWSGYGDERSPWL
jgi:hypothetical protein